ncbi:sensor histidine kinase [Terricaulis silvestris]|nr:sensor histidine kinase [Terricaulis silvestris]
MALLLGLAMLPAGAIAMQVGLNAVEARQAAFEETLGRRALQSISVERSAIDELRELLRVLAASPELRESGVGDCREWLGGVVERYRTIASMAVTDDRGFVRCSVPAAPSGFRSRNSALRQRAVARDGFTIGFVEYSALAQRPVLAAMEPIRNDAGRRVGFVSASMAIDDLRELLDRGRSLDGARAVIVDLDGRIIAQSSVDRSRRAPGLPTVEQIRRMIGPEPAFIEVPHGNAVVVPLHAPDLYAVMSWAPDQSPVRRWAGLAVSIAAPLMIWLLAIGAGWFAIEIFVARPLSQLESAARGFARGEDVMEGPSLASAPDEIRSLRRTLAAMAKTLRGREQRLIEALSEERALLREVHHRVKNNLQMVASLLNIQARDARDESEAWGLARAHDRVQLMALVHQRIYSSGEVRALRLDDLAAEIARQLLQSRGAQAKDVTPKIDVGEARVDVDRAVPLAFLIGEGISAALDSLADARGELALSLRQDPDGEARFAIITSGQAANTPSPSTRLIDAFARQLGASVGRTPGSAFALWVRVPPAAHNSAAGQSDSATRQDHTQQQAGAE